MVDASGIPRRITPTTGAERQRALERQVQQLDSARPLYPVWGDVYNAEKVSFDLTPELTQLLSVTVNVPEGFTTALVQASADMNFLNTANQIGSTGLLIRINGERQGLARSSNDAPPSTLTYVGSSFSKRLEVSPGSFYVTCEGFSTPGNWRSTGDEGVSLSVMVTFLRQA